MKERTTSHTKLFLMAALATLLVGTALYAQPPGRGARPFGPGGGIGPVGLIERFGDQLELSEAQRQEIEEVFEAQRTEADPLRAQLQEYGKALEATIHAETLNESAVRAAAQNVAGVKMELAVLRAQGFQSVQAVLTPEQREKLAELRELRQERRESFGRFGGRHPRGRGKRW